MAVHHFPVKVGEEKAMVTCYWAKAPGYSEADVLKTWSAGDGARQQDAVELAKLAAMKWEATCDYGTVASTIGEMQTAVRRDAQAEVTVMLLAEAKWFEERLLGVALLHRTWSGNIFLDFLAAHPATAGQVGGVGVGLLIKSVIYPRSWGQGCSGVKPPHIRLSFIARFSVLSTWETNCWSRSSNNVPSARGSRTSGGANVDNFSRLTFIGAMAGKKFQDMSLDEVFEFERTHSFDVGRRVVTESGFKRHQTRLHKTIRGLLKPNKRRKTALA
jgi:hypothetical protein